MKTYKHRELPCVYMIEMDNGKDCFYYIGKSKDGWQRWEEHYTALKFGNYATTEEKRVDSGKDLMQKHWNKYGKHCFSFKVLCERSNMALINELEAHLIKRFKPAYNTVHATEGEQQPFFYQEVENFLRTWLPIQLREMPLNKPFKWSTTWARMVDLRITGISKRTKTEYTQMLLDVYPDKFKIERNLITRIK